jgi:hypothetical protein
MALFNNYDMKDSQNSLYQGEDNAEMVVSDLGATLGPTGSRWPTSTKRGALETYERTKFITKVRANTVDFAAPSWPMMFGFLPMPPLPYTLFTYPVVLFGKMPAPDVIGERWIGRGIPRKDARWMGDLLHQLTPEQIRAAFRSANYSPEEVEGFSEVIERRIAALEEL